MEFWFGQGNDKFRLPVPPADFSIQKSLNNTSVVVEDFGEITLIGQKKLAPISITSFFPLKYYNFCQYSDFEPPYKLVEKIETWIDSKKPIRFFITYTNVDMLCSIENFSYGEKDGTGDVHFTLALKEYRSVDVESTTSKEKRPVTKEPPATYTVKSGDYLILIAKKCYGDGSKWRELYNKNKSVIGPNPSLIYPGQVYTL